MAANLSTMLWSMTAFGDWVEAEIKRMETTPTGFARRVGVNPSLVTRWIQGVKPSTESIKKIEESLFIRDNRLMILAGHMTTDEPLPETDIRSEIADRVVKVNIDNLSNQMILAGIKQTLLTKIES